MSWNAVDEAARTGGTGPDPAAEAGGIGRYRWVICSLLFLATTVNYIDRQLCGPFENLQQTYRRGIAGIDESSRLISGRAFADLNAQQQIDVLHRLEGGQAPGAVWKHASSSEFFALVIDHTMQGYYGDPRHGGNRDGMSWKMLGLPYPPIRGRSRYDLTKL